ncbi:MAG: histidine phosphatase family protein [Tenuifilaceae bacterium]|jgi:phosphohistidine phosphatase|nr:histidine phosphatase family protein [Bacteroidales bacterium]MDI9517007.1 histidine phosphatase family protein [Bacteroidota bacterium]NLH56310.1 histidine phosphatase family protein [Rikenellaceae bacterium]OQC61168.1 MAG: phosphohistidine phosphatase [Bacteroidetes bacterium ADurb.Bin008]HNV81486.1 histidine phosphatase family protein [Tenuifilaceae bacterium]
MDNSKTLIILRHAKSSWAEPGVQDFDRSLEPKGVKDITMMAGKMKAKVSELEAIFSSPAERAIHTAMLFAQTVGFPQEKIHVRKDLYTVGHLQLRDMVKAFKNDLSTVMVVGHNPTLTDFVNLFLDRPIDNVPTSGIVGLTFSAKKWEGIEQKTLTSSFFHYPKEFR